MLPCQRHLFNLPKDIAYLNCAYLSPQLHRVSEAGHRSVAMKESPWLVKPSDFFENTEAVRGLFAQVVGTQADNIAIVPAVSYAMAVAAKNVLFSSGQRILVLSEQFPSNVYPWMELVKEYDAELVTVDAPEDRNWTQAILEKLDETIALVALPNCHWTDGSLIDLVKIGKQCRALQSALVIDATQSLGAWPLNVEEVQPDFLVAAGYKWMLGPYSLGYLYVAPKYHQGLPLEHNWISRKNSEDFAGLVNYREEFQDGARRFDVGERSNFTLMPMSREALSQILEWGVPNIAAAIGKLTELIAQRATDLGLYVTPNHLRATHMLGIHFPQGVPDTLTDQLVKNQIYVSVRGSSVRIAPHVYNTVDDVDRLFEVLQAVL